MYIIIEKWRTFKLVYKVERLDGIKYTYNNRQYNQRHETGRHELYQCAETHSRHDREATGNLTVEQPPKKDRKRQNEIKKAGSNLRPFLKEQASEPHVCICSFQTPSPYMEK